jgi:hypothetical protein
MPYSYPLNLLQPLELAAAPPAQPIARFEVRSGLNGTDRETWGTIAQFDNGRDAGAYVAEHKAGYSEAGKSLAIVKVELDASTHAIDWRAREAQRLTDGTYTPLPAGWYSSISIVYPDHFAHVAQSDKRKVAFTESEASGERDKQKVLSASAYLDRYLVPHLTESSRQAFLADMLGDSIAPLFTPLGDPDAMERVYRQTEGTEAHGCMSYDLSSYSSDIHPVRVYAMNGAEDIQLAFLRGGTDRSIVDIEAEWNSSGPVLARCLVWETVKQYGRVYGEASHARMLRTALEAKGFSSGSLTGARIAKVESSSGVYVMPYLDIGEGTVSDGGTNWIVGGGEYDANSTNGLLNEGRCTCDRCGDNYNEDDMRTVYVEEGMTENWCEGCAEYYAFWCEVSEEIVSDNNQETYEDERGYATSCASWVLCDTGAIECSDGIWRLNAFICDECGEGFPNYEANHCEEDGFTVCESCFDDRQEHLELERERERELEASPELPLSA